MAALLVLIKNMRSFLHLILDVKFLRYRFGIHGVETFLAAALALNSSQEFLNFPSVADGCPVGFFERLEFMR